MQSVMIGSDEPPETPITVADATCHTLHQHPIPRILGWTADAFRCSGEQQADMNPGEFTHPYAAGET